MITLVDLLKPITDEKSLALFNTIANGDSNFCITALQLTRKQYYSRLSALLKAGVVKRVRGKYSLTSCGVILYHAQELIGKAVNQYSQLNAIDSIRESGSDDFPQEQFYSIIDKLIASQEIKNILLKHFKGDSSFLKSQEAAVMRI
jgi:predicted transcriptional regulator